MNLELIRQHTTKTILRFSVPSIIAMILTSLVTIVDGFFIGNYIGADGIAAVNLGLPIIYLFLSIGLMVSVGGAAIAGMTFGGGNLSACSQVFRQTIATTVLFSVLTCLVVLAFFDPMLNFLGAKGQVRESFKIYYGILLPELVIMVVNSSFGMFLRAEGSPILYMKINLIHVSLNVFLDYIGTAALHLGIAGIAAASLLSALISLLLTLHFFLKRAKVYRLGAFTFDSKVLKSTLANGSSEFIGEMSIGIAMFAYNFVIMQRIGVNGVTAFTIVGYVSYLFNMIVVGFGQGASPLVSFAFGACEPALARKIRQKTNRFVFIIGTAAFLLLALFQDQYSRLFIKDDLISQMIRSGMSLFMISFFFSGINAITSFYFTAIGKALASAVISSSRGLVVLLSCIFILPAYLGMTGIWLAAPITEAITFVITASFLLAERYKFLNSLI